MMNEILNYSLQSAACFVVFYLFYLIVLKKETCFHYNRFYLITASLLALALPMINFYWLFNIGPENDMLYLPTIQLPEIVITEEGNYLFDQIPWLTLKSLLIITYFSGLILFLSRFIIQLATIKRIIHNNRFQTRYHNTCYVIETHGKLPTFSFIKYLFWDNSVPFTAHEKEQIFKHELVHIRGKHSYDILYFEIINIIFWFNPLIMLFKKEITDVHEFIADSRVLKQVNQKGYASLVVKQLFKSMDLSLGSHFSKSQVQRRLQMIENARKRANLMKVTSSIPFILVIMGLMGFNLSQESDSFNGLSDADDNNIALLHRPNSQNPEKKTYTNELDDFIEDNLSQAKNKLAEASSINSKKQNTESASNASTHTDRPGTAVPVITGKENESLDFEENSTDEVYTLVEFAPKPVGGMKAFYKSISSNLKYPNQARRMGIEGKVFVQFIIEKDGTPSDVQAIKGIGAGCDIEAVRVISESKAWIPGIQAGIPVRVRMVIPITFKLN